MTGKQILLISLALLLSLVSVTRAQPYILIDDFETYASPSELYAVWEDWHTLPEQGGEVYLEHNNVHGGQQAMEFRYLWLYGTPVTRNTFDSPQDWTAGGLAALWLWFYGDANDEGTVAEGMYVELGDDDNSDGTVDDKAKIFYGDPRTVSSSSYGDVNDLWRKSWYEWGLSLQDFNEANDVNPNKIKTIAFGVTGGTVGVEEIGRIYYDDIRLYVPRCIPEYGSQFGDIAGEEGPDCVINYWDVGLMGEEWLTGGIKADIVEDDNVNLKDYDIVANNWLRMVLWPP